MAEQDGYIRNRWGLWLALMLGALLAAGVARRHRIRNSRTAPL